MNLKIPAHPTRFGGILFRSRLEARWACWFEMVRWKNSYEPLELRNRIPDFVMHFAHPTIIECKPSFTVADLTAHRRAMVRSAAGWLLEETERELRMLDRAPNRADDLVRADALIADVEAVRDRLENPAHGRRALVVGSRMFETSSSTSSDMITVDGQHGFYVCGDHLGLADASSGCLVCGARDPGAPAPSADILTVWREAGNRVQWNPPMERSRTENGTSR